MGSIVLVTTCGTSSLTYGLGPDDRTFLTKWANARSEAELPKEDRERLERLACEQGDALERSSAEEARRRSAEINGILSYVGNVAEVDLHLLVPTDTVLGQHAADGGRRWLEARGAAVEAKAFPGLQVRDQRELDRALAECARWVFKDLDWVRSAPGKRLVFHTTGGFKAVQGFFQTLGLLRADETVYLFEGSDTVMRIPRLPLAADLGFLGRERLLAVRRLRRGLDAEAAGLPEALAEEGDPTPYGHCLREAGGAENPPRDLLPSISDRVRFGPDLPKTVRAEDSARLPTVNRRLEELALWVETGAALSGLDVKPIRGGKLGASTHEADAWHDGGAKRFFLHREGEAWVVDRIGEALH
ncbi:MAG: hypothetical protein ACK41F_04805 [Fimbriimonadaceae bacterium]